MNDSESVVGGEVTTASEAVPSSLTDSLTRGFLFSDLRDYTTFVESNGATAAADLLYRYRALVRAAVARHRGAEVKTEGDSFYVVFPSVSRAVECGLEIVQAAERDNAANPSAQIGVGVGVHAGETVETAEGYVGSAVNVAARICSVAASGEVLVSDTVRILTSNSSGIRFVARGTRHLKGVSEPVALYAVGPDAKAQARARRAWILPAAAGVAVLVVTASLAGLAFVLSQGPAATPTAATPTAPATGIATAPATASFIAPSQPSAVPTFPAELLGPVATQSPGRYRLALDRPPVVLSLPKGWVVMRDFADGFELLRWDDPPSGSPIGYVNIYRVQVVFDGPCKDSPTRLLPQAPDALVNALAANEWLTASDPLPVNLGGASGLRVDVQLARVPDASTCPDSSGGRVAAYLFQLGDSDFWLQEDERVRVLVLDVSATPLTLLVGAQNADYERTVVDADAVLTSIEFVSGE